jgi:hypothetical protein
VIPVFSNNHLSQELLKLEEQKYLRSLVFLNCGGSLELQNYWFFDHPEVKAYLMDYHRPYFHGNVIERSDKIIVIQDGCSSFQDCPTLEDD